MSAAEAVDLARAHGVCITVEGDRLLLAAPAPPPPEVLDLMRQHKPELMRLLSGRTATLDPDEIEEKTGIVGADAGIARAWTEGLAKLSAMPAPVGWGRDWREVRDGAIRLADELAGAWLVEAYALG